MATAKKEECNIIRLNINNWSQLGVDDNIYSDRKNYSGFPWRLRAYKTSDNLIFILYIYKEEESNVWFCDASVDAFIVNHGEEGKKHKIPTVPAHKTRFTPLNCENGIQVILDKPSLLQDPALGFIKEDSVVVEVHITVNSDNGDRFRKKVEYDMFNPSPKSDGILIVQGTKVYVSKQFLSVQSPFFDRIFFGKFKEAEEPETEIQDVLIDEFEVLIKMLYRTGEPFTAENVEYILKLADRFEMLSMLDEAEKYLLHSKGPEIHQKLRLCDQYNLIVLKDQLIPKYTASLIRDLKKSSDFGKLKEETKDILFQKYIDLTWK